MLPDLSDTFDLITANYEISVSLLGLVLLAIVFWRKRNSALGALKGLECEDRDPARHLTPVAAADWIRLRIECAPELIQFSRLAVLGPLFGVGLGSSFLFLNGGMEIKLAALAAPVFCGAMVAVLHAFYSIQVDRYGALLIGAYANSYADSPRQLSEGIRRAGDSLSNLVHETEDLKENVYPEARIKLHGATGRLEELAGRVNDLIEEFQRLPASLNNIASSVETALTKIVADLPAVKNAVDGFNDDLKASKKEVKQRSERIVESYGELRNQLKSVQEGVAKLDSVAKGFGELKAAHVEALQHAVDASVTKQAEALERLVGLMEATFSKRTRPETVSVPSGGTVMASQEGLMIGELRKISLQLGKLENQLDQISRRPAFIAWTRNQLARLKTQIQIWRGAR